MRSFGEVYLLYSIYGSVYSETDNALTCCGYPISILIFWTVHSPPPTGRQMALFRNRTSSYFFGSESQRTPTILRIFNVFQIFNVVNILFLQYSKVYEPISGFFIVKFLLPVMVIGNAWKWISLETSSVPVALRFTSLDVDWNGNRRPSENMIRQPLDMTYP